MVPMIYLYKHKFMHHKSRKRKELKRKEERRKRRKREGNFNIFRMIDDFDNVICEYISLS
jgi:hypothetical protein